MDMAKERFFATVLHLDRATGCECQQTAVHLQADVLAPTEGATDTAESESHAFERQTKTRGNLFLILMQPLRSHVQLNTGTVIIGQRQRCFETEKGLVLHAHFVGAFDHHFADEILIAAHHFLAANHIAIGVNRRE